MAPTGYTRGQGAWEAGLTTGSPPWPGAEGFFGYSQFEVSGSSKTIRAVLVKLDANDEERIALPAQ